MPGVLSHNGYGDAQPRSHDSAKSAKTLHNASLLLWHKPV
jgi:hypothetical protein